jgi:hypothetical protein
VTTGEGRCTLLDGASLRGVVVVVVVVVVVQVQEQNNVHDDSKSSMINK